MVVCTTNLWIVVRRVCYESELWDGCRLWGGGLFCLHISVKRALSPRIPLAVRVKTDISTPLCANNRSIETTNEYNKNAKKNIWHVTHPNSNKKRNTHFIQNAANTNHMTIIRRCTSEKFRFVKVTVRDSGLNTLEKMFVKARNLEKNIFQPQNESATAERCKYRAVENFYLQLPCE